MSSSEEGMEYCLFFWEYLLSEAENIHTQSPKSTNQTMVKYLPVLPSPLPTFDEIDILTAN